MLSSAVVGIYRLPTFEEETLMPAAKVSRLTRISTSNPKVISWNGRGSFIFELPIFVASTLGEFCEGQRLKNLACISQAKRTQSTAFAIFGGLAILATYVAVDPWLCVAGFHRVCLYRMFFH
jgi:hypothetical protein